MSQNGFIFPKFRGKNIQNISNHHLAKVYLCIFGTLAMSGGSTGIAKVFFSAPSAAEAAFSGVGRAAKKNPKKD